TKSRESRPRVERGARGADAHGPGHIVVAARVVRAHRYGAVLRPHHEGAVADALRIQRRRVHEVVDEEGELSDALAPPQRPAYRPELARQEQTASGQPVGLA